MAISRVQSKTGGSAGVDTLAITLDSAIGPMSTALVTVAMRHQPGPEASCVMNNGVGALHRLPQYPAENVGEEIDGITIDRWGIDTIPPGTAAAATITLDLDGIITDVCAIVEIFTEIRPFGAVDRYVSAGSNLPASQTTGTTGALRGPDEMLSAAWAWNTNATAFGVPTNSFSNILTVSVGTSVRLYVAHRVVVAIGGTYESSLGIAVPPFDAVGAIDTFFHDPEFPPPGTTPARLIPILAH